MIKEKEKQREKEENKDKKEKMNEEKLKNENVDGEKEMKMNEEKLASLLQEFIDNSGTLFPEFSNKTISKPHNNIKEIAYNQDKPKYILLEKTKSFYTIMHPYLELFPKSEKFTLRQRIEETILDAIKILILQNYRETDEERRKLMLEFIANINLLEILLQQSIIFKYLSFGAYQKTLVLVREINSIALVRYRNLNGGIE